MIHVVIIDDSFMVRTLFQRELSRDPAIHVVGTAGNAASARDLVIHNPAAVVVLGLGLLGGDSLNLLRWLRLQDRHQVIALIKEDAEAPRRRAVARELGAHLIAKGRSSLDATTMIEQVRGALKRLGEHPSGPSPQPASGPPPGPAYRVVAIGASTGGTEALDHIITRLPANAPPILVVQHMPVGFTAALADRLDRHSAVSVREGGDGDPVAQGCVYISPGDQHMGIREYGGRYRIRLSDGPTVNRHKPSVDVLFLSMAKHVGRAAVGVLLTGMGADGAHGLKAVRDAGGSTIAQDQASCVVFGMPKEAIALGAAQQVLPLADVPASILELCQIRGLPVA